ncbi:hypothetical protein J421_2332 [Gemmatirosa kalamazoonensis]|uniref:Uncharacterized protein n=1 Tax=Gemmatirosa kalamazoonensis TaxID=861299 RepID=W0RFJ8_9BACT|nr:hypothetical protein [Gemmatirosa kalamazoonensis]AHG89869.1 hypothetical protein J421_2332 [Gemmatirosa kalamazoonensis]
MDEPRDTCDHCGSARLVWRKCKQICLDCGRINRSCADLRDDDAPPSCAVA